MADPKRCNKYEVRPNIKMCSEHLHGYVISANDNPPPYNESKRELGPVEMDLKRIKTSHLVKCPEEDEFSGLKFYL